MTKHQLPQRIQHQKAGTSSGRDVAHLVPRPVHRCCSEGDAVQGGPQQLGAHLRIELFQPPAEYRHQTIGQRERAAAEPDVVGESRKFRQRQRIAGGLCQNLRRRSRRQRHGGLSQ